MKKLLAVALLGLVALSSCKKGEDDPALSLRSRDARITGEWTLSDYTYSSTDYEYTDVDEYSTTTTTKSYDGINITTTATTTGLSSGVQLDAIPNVAAEGLTWELTIDKDGTYTSVKTKVRDLAQPLDKDVDEETGYWSWVDSKKNKVGIRIGDEFYIIKQLKNKEIVLIADAATNDSKSSTFDNGVEAGNDSYSSEAIWTFVQ